MKTTYKNIFVIAVSSMMTVAVVAQTVKNDTTLNRQVLLERDFSPTLKDASKIVTLPTIDEPVVKPAAAKFETRKPNLVIEQFPIGDTDPGDAGTKIDYSNKRGYMTFGAGNYLNLNGTLGYRAVDEKWDKLDLFFIHNSTNGNVSYANPVYDLKSAKAKLMDNMFKANYQHDFYSFMGHLDASYQNVGYNYYGNPFDFSNIQNLDFNSRQNLGLIELSTGIKSYQNDAIKYDMSLKYNHFSNKYGPRPSDNGVSGNIFDARFDFGAIYDTEKLIGIRFGVLNQSFGKVAFVTNKDDYFHALTNLKFNPYINMDGDDWKISLGVNLNYMIDKKNSFLLSPDIKASWQFADETSLYATVDGGINENTVPTIFLENRYVNPGEKIYYSKTLYNSMIGVKSGIIDCFEFNVFAGYKHTQDDHLFTPNTTGAWANVSKAIYANISEGRLGAVAKTKLIPYTDLSVSLTSYFYDVKYSKRYNVSEELPFEKKAWNRPSTVFNLNADVKPFDKFTITANYNLIAGRKGLLDGNSVKMANINELNFAGNYELLDFLSIHANVNNVLNQKYDTWLGYTHQRFNMMAGLSLKF